MAINTERAGRLITKLGAVEEKITNLTQERDELLREIQNSLGTTSATDISTPTKKSSTSTATKGNLGDKIMKYLQANGQADLAKLAKGLKVAPNQIGLALYHMTKKGNVFSDKGIYYPSVDLGAAAKSSPPDSE